jgi:hypothetical protein
MAILPGGTDIFGISKQSSSLSSGQYLNQVVSAVLKDSMSLLDSAVTVGKSKSAVIKAFKEAAPKDPSLTKIILISSSIPPSSNYEAIQAGKALLAKVISVVEKVSVSSSKGLKGITSVPTDIAGATSGVSSTLRDVSRLKNVPKFLTEVGVAGTEVGGLSKGILGASRIGEYATTLAKPLASGRSALDIQGRLLDAVTKKAANYAVTQAPATAALLGAPAAVLGPISLEIASLSKAAMIGGTGLGRTAALALGLPGPVGAIIAGAAVLYGTDEATRIIGSKLGTPLRKATKTVAGGYAGAKIGVAVAGPYGALVGGSIGALLGLKLF